MMRHFKLAAPILVLSFVTAACAQQAGVEKAATEPAAAEVSAPKLGAPFATVKPGAGVSFTHTVNGNESARSGVVDLQVEEYYLAGSLMLEASGEDGLSVFGATRNQRVDMASGVMHAWSVNYEAEQDGVYYLNVQATAEPEGQPMSMRSYSVRIEIGDFVPGAEKARNGDVTTTADGDLIIVMEAEETIE